MFHHAKKSTSPSTPAPAGFLEVVAANQIITSSKYDDLTTKILTQSHLDSVRFELLVLQLIHQIANYYQRLPETTHHYYALPGGLFEHALNRTEAALQLAQPYMLQEQEVGLSENQTLWLYALASASLLRGIGKLPTDYHVEQHDPHQKEPKRWNPLAESLAAKGLPYQYRLNETGEKILRCRLSLLLARHLMPQQGFTWIASDLDVLRVWLALIDEDEEGAGTLGAILDYADAIAIQRYLAEFDTRLSGKPGGSGGGKAIPPGSIQRPGRIGAFTDTTPLTIAEKEHLMGAEFIKWFTSALENKKIMINKAPLRMVPGGLIMLPEMFQLFVREHPEYKNAHAVEKGFLSWGLHRVRPDGSIVFSKYAVGLPKSVALYREHQETSTLHAVECLRQLHAFEKNKSWASATSAHVLNAKGDWIPTERAPQSLKPGAPPRG